MATAPANTPEYSVSEIAGALKRTVESAFGQVRVRGEISGLKIAASGHAYLCLKDERAVLDSVMWKAGVQALRFRPEDGLEVIATGKLTTYPGRSKYQIVIESLEPAGAGALMALLEQRRAKLAGEGLFAAERKRALPFLPATIGVVTSPTGAVIRDILHRLADRFPRRVIVWPVLVQGEAAASQISAAIDGFNTMQGADRPDLLIVARGGGSIEDLWAFNEEAVVRAVAASAIPTISAVGHETDTTLVDFAADRRAPTPTAAAEMAVPVREELRLTVADLALRAERAHAKCMAARAERVAAIACRLPSPRTLLGLKQQRFDELAERLPRALAANVQVHRTQFTRAGAALRPALVGRALERSRHRLDAAALRPEVVERHIDRARQRFGATARLLASLDYHATLRRGFALVRSKDGRLVTGTDAAKRASVLQIQFADGHIDVVSPRQGVLF